MKETSGVKRKNRSYMEHVTHLLENILLKYCLLVHSNYFEIEDKTKIVGVCFTKTIKKNKKIQVYFYCTISE